MPKIPLKRVDFLLPKVRVAWQTRMVSFLESQQLDGLWLLGEQGVVFAQKGADGRIVPLHRVDSMEPEEVPPAAKEIKPKK